MKIARNILLLITLFVILSILMSFINILYKESYIDVDQGITSLNKIFKSSNFKFENNLDSSIEVAKRATQSTKLSEGSCTVPFREILNVEFSDIKDYETGYKLKTSCLTLPVVKMMYVGNKNFRFQLKNNLNQNILSFVLLNPLFIEIENTEAYVPFIVNQLTNWSFDSDKLPNNLIVNCIQLIDSKHFRKPLKYLRDLNIIKSNLNKNEEKLLDTRIYYLEEKEHSFQNGRAISFKNSQNMNRFNIFNPLYAEYSKESELFNFNQHLETILHSNSKPIFNIKFDLNLSENSKILNNNSKEILSMYMDIPDYDSCLNNNTTYQLLPSSNRNIFNVIIDFHKDKFTLNIITTPVKCSTLDKNNKLSVDIPYQKDNTLISCFISVSPFEKKLLVSWKPEVVKYFIYNKTKIDNLNVDNTFNNIFSQNPDSVIKKGKIDMVTDNNYIKKVEYIQLGHMNLLDVFNNMV